MGTDGYYLYCGYHFIIYANVKSLYRTPESYVIFYINYISIKNVYKCKSCPNEEKNMVGHM